MREDVLVAAGGIAAPQKVSVSAFQEGGEEEKRGKKNALHALNRWRCISMPSKVLAVEFSLLVRVRFSSITARRRRRPAGFVLASFFFFYCGIKSRKTVIECWDGRMC